MTWTDLLQAISDTPVGAGIRESGVLFPWIESVHVLAATTVVGTIAIVDLRLLGYASHRRGARKLILDLLPFTWVAFALALITGALLFTSNAVVYAIPVVDEPFDGEPAPSRPSDLPDRLTGGEQS